MGSAVIWAALLLWALFLPPEFGAEAQETIQKTFQQTGDLQNCGPTAVTRELAYDQPCGYLGQPCTAGYRNTDSVEIVCDMCFILTLRQEAGDNMDCLDDVCPPYDLTALVVVRAWENIRDSDGEPVWTVNQQGWSALCPFTCEHDNPLSPLPYPDCVQDSRPVCRKGPRPPDSVSGTVIDVSGSYAVNDQKLVGWQEANCQTGEPVENGRSGGIAVGTIPVAPTTTTTTTTSPTTQPVLTDPASTTMPPGSTSATAEGSSLDQGSGGMGYGSVIRRDLWTLGLLLFLGSMVF